MSEPPSNLTSPMSSPPERVDHGAQDAGSIIARPKLLGARRLLGAFLNSWKGLYGAFKAEQAFRQEVLLAVVLIPSGFWIGETAIEKILLVGSMLFVLIVELLNTAVETVVDRIGLERHVLSGLAKDVGSAAVLLSFVVLLLVWGLLLFG
jgi:diacylglycerol kinase (ATP)